MKTETVNISKIKSNPNNPRTIRDDKFKNLVQSIKDFPEMLNIRPIVVNEQMVVLGGNMRLKACIEAGVKEVPVIITKLSEQKQKEFIIKDNVAGGEWDWSMLANEWEEEELKEWGLEVVNYSSGHEINNLTEEDIDLDEQFDPIGTMDGKQRVVFLFNNPEDAENYLKSINVKFKKMNMAWQVNMSIQST